MDSQQQQSQLQPEPQPAPQPTSQPTPPSGQPPYQSPMPTGVMDKPKKSKVGLIVGIVIGSLTFILIVAAILLYFLWWQNPKKMVADAVVNLINTKQAIANGKISVSGKGMGMVVDIKQSVDDSKSSSDISIKLSLEQFSSDIKLGLKGVYANDGVIYVRADGLEKAIDMAIEEYVDYMSKSVDYGVTDIDMDATRSEIKKLLNPIVDKVDGQWLKFSTDDLTRNSKSTKCVSELSSDLRKDKKLTQEIIKTYKENDFLIIKEGIPSKGGATGFEIDLNSKEAKDKAQDFSDAMEKTEFAKRLKKCSEDLNSSSGGRSGVANDSATESKASLRVWIDPWTHSLKSFEFNIDGGSSGSTVKVEYDLQPGKSEKVEVPSNAKNGKEVIDEVSKLILDGAAGYVNPSLSDRSYMYEDDTLFN